MTPTNEDLLALADRLAAVDLWPDKEDVSEAMNAKGYFWQTCSGCHETHEGVPTGPVHPVLGCAVGHGCYECGGIGAVWDTTDYADLSDFLADKDRALPVAAPLCTWPSCGHTAKGQCRTYTSGQLIAPNDASITATNIPVAEPEPLAVKVKPLQWHKSHMSGWDGDWHTVPTGYTIRCADENGWKWSTPLGAFGYGHSPEAAKSAAEADHAARIRSQIDAVPAAQVRAEALEEAAALPPYDCDGDPAGSFDHHVFVKRDAIRALIEKENFYLYLCAR